jgi:hypothetical protein
VWGFATGAVAVWGFAAGTVLFARVPAFALLSATMTVSQKINHAAAGLMQPRHALSGQI